MSSRPKARYLADSIRTLALGRNKMAFISGPRQVGKTTLSKSFLNDSGNYYNWDQLQFRRIWAKNPESLTEEFKKVIPRPVLVLDEIYKARRWKQSLKGIYDTLPTAVDIIVTGSARLDVYQKGSDSLHGRYVPFRLHPFSVGELLNSKNQLDPDNLLKLLVSGDLSHDSSSIKALEMLVEFGGFPEPLFEGNKAILNIWQRTRCEKIIREDLRDLSRLPDLSQIEMLVALLPERAAQMLSRASLREDLEVAHTTITRWMGYLEALYYHFEVKPYQTRIKNTLKKEGKLYLWDYSEVSNLGSRFENLVACHLLKACHFWTDIGLGNFELRYLRDKAGKEIDFLIVRDRKPWLPIEVKLSDDSPSPHWSTFLSQIHCPVGLQVINRPKVHSLSKVNGGVVRVLSAGSFLKHLP